MHLHSPKAIRAALTLGCAITFLASPLAVAPASATNAQADIKAPDTKVALADDATALSNGLTKKKISAALAALNAANASDAAFENANPNSRVAKIVAYRDQMLANEELRQSLAETKAMLDELDAPEFTAEEYAAAVSAAKAEQAQLADDIKALSAKLDKNGDDDELSASLQIARSDLAYAKVRVAGLVDPAPYNATLKALDEGQKNLAKQEKLATNLLRQAANKRVTAEVIAEVNRLLGLSAQGSGDEMMQNDLAAATE